MKIKLSRVRIEFEIELVEPLLIDFELLYQEQLSVRSLPSYFILIWFMSTVYFTVEEFTLLPSECIFDVIKPKDVI